MTSVIIRIALRYVAAALVARGLLTPEDGTMLASDPELASLIDVGLGVGLGAVAEAWYLLARKLGWAK